MGEDGTGANLGLFSCFGWRGEQPCRKFGTRNPLGADFDPGGRKKFVFYPKHEQFKIEHVSNFQHGVESFRKSTTSRGLPKIHRI